MRSCYANVQGVRESVVHITAFRDIVKPLKDHLGLSFGYTICFKKDFSYLTLVDNQECAREFSDTVDEDCVWCGKNMTAFGDLYNFTLWPEEPHTKAMQVFFKYSIWGGITSSHEQDNFRELWWFAPCRQGRVTQELIAVN